MGLSGGQKTNITSVESAIATARAALNLNDQDQKEVDRVLKRLERELARIRSHRDK